ncbi:G-PROTEIN-RECEP-F1-2 domain-containing protein [Aphelenchoides fujianensis]|nr:G-PROTEIN-RECEP-F1-2 domain-containing protein [Aphelenchoides fujianensis]
MDSIAAFYSTIHSPLALALCVSGIAGHCFAIWVLLVEAKQQPDERLSCVQFVIFFPSSSRLISCFVTLYKFFSESLCWPLLWTYSFTVLFLISVNLSVLVHMAGVFHVVVSTFRCVKFLVGIYTSVLVLCFPLYFHSEIQRAEEPDESCVERFPALREVPAWFGSICKLVPCAILLVMSLLILRQLKAIREMSARFQNSNRERQHARTTKIILVIMVVFIVVELPQGILAVAQGIIELPVLGELGDLFEMLTLLTSCLIFGLFLLMNARLREAFVEVIDRAIHKITPRGWCRTSTPDSTKEALFGVARTDSRRYAAANGISEPPTTFVNTDL